MRRKDRELPVDEAWRILAAGRVAHLGLISGGHPYVVPVSHVVLDGKIYFHSAREGEKVDLAAIAAKYEPGYPRRESDEDTVAVVEIAVDRITGKQRR